MPGTETFYKGSATDVVDALSIIYAQLVAAGWTDATGGSGIVNFGSLGGSSSGNNGGHIHLNSPNSKCMVNLAAGARRSSGQTDSGSGDSGVQPGTPHQYNNMRIDANKNGDPTDGTGYSWSGATSPMGWIAVNCSDYNGYSGSNHWAAQTGYPKYNNQNRPFMLMAQFEGTGGGGLGPAISDLWVICHANPSTVFIVAKKVTSLGYVVWQHIMFGEDIHKGSTFTGGAWFNASHYPWNSNDSGNVDFDYAYFQPTGFALGNQRSTSLQNPFARTMAYTVIKCDDTVGSVVADHPCLGGRTNNWGCGGGNVWTGAGMTYATGSTFQGCYYLPLSTFEYSSAPSGALTYDSNRGYLKIEEIIGFRRAADGQGGYFLGTLPNCGLTSTEAYLGGNEVVADGDTYLVFPFHSRVSPWTSIGMSPNWDSTTYASRQAHHYGVGLAIRKP